MARVGRHDCQGGLGAVDLEQEPRPVGGAAFELDRCDRAALEDAAYEHLVCAFIWIISPVSTIFTCWRWFATTLDSSLNSPRQ